MADTSGSALFNAMDTDGPPRTGLPALTSGQLAQPQASSGSTPAWGFGAPAPAAPAAETKEVKRPRGAALQLQMLLADAAGHTAAGNPDLDAQTAALRGMGAQQLYTMEQFDADGMPVAEDPTMPRGAAVYATPTGRAGEVTLTRQPGEQTYQYNTRDGGVRTQHVVTYATEYMNYKVNLVNGPDGTVDPSQPFEAERTMKADGREMGRTNRISQERWALNPAYAGALTPQQATRGLAQEDAYDPTQHSGGFEALPADASHPVVYYVQRGVRDANFSSNDRQFMTPAAFDAEYDRRTLAGGAGTKAQTKASKPYALDRGVAGRSPAGTMGLQAHELMGDDGQAGAAGLRLSSHEWCHLVGDGDGGANHRDNLVIGTNAANTEQLAMEIGLRPFRRRLGTADADIMLTVKALTTDSPDGDARGRGHKAQFISYEISVRESDGTTHAIHRQIIDGQRGTITNLEFNRLKEEVSNKLRPVVDRLQAVARRALRDDGDGDRKDASPRSGRDVSRTVRSNSRGRKGEARGREEDRKSSRDRDRSGSPGRRSCKGKSKIQGRSSSPHAKFS